MPPRRWARPGRAPEAIGAWSGRRGPLQSTALGPACTAGCGAFLPLPTVLTFAGGLLPCVACVSTRALLGQAPEEARCPVRRLSAAT